VGIGVGVEVGGGVGVLVGAGVCVSAGVEVGGGGATHAARDDSKMRRSKDLVKVM
jgi:hypothetical protein